MQQQQELFDLIHSSIATKVATLAPDEQDKIAEVRSLFHNIMSQHGDAARVGLVLFQLEYKPPMGAPYGEAFDNFGIASQAVDATA